ncbi:MAG: Abortive infection protein AbiEi [bacterium (Candidatus Stahlbacteria) CG08_land_8_20_14_0_20_40_26]|nr:MAG: Abortive infection protein AbiEi [bacterium (Candidatus Stahlbacteria) CG23_combo_of_CG06-09_8_20_14_all_40_9]PIS23862.1 MAG: Abortive infection protein AbiEi [bacterium (Candidatus Stahlbacteria) CG08_land_8_20_14_0_20_40_26]
MNKKHEKIIKIFKIHNGYARSKDILAEGIHPRDIKNILDKGLIIKVKNGLYKLTDIPVISNQSFIDLARAVPEGVICLLSALSYHELTTFNPSIISMAIYRKSWRPKIEYPPVEFYYFSTKQFKTGIDEIKIKAHKVRIYCPEKTICDCFRYRNKLGLDTAKEGLSEYLKQKDRNLEKIVEYAEICRVKPLLQTWLNAMI